MRKLLTILSLLSFVCCYGVCAGDDKNSEQEVAKATELDWPSENPKGPPTLTAYSQLSVEMLTPLILGDGETEWRDHSILACAWYMWKTREGDGAQKQRTDLADRIFAKLKQSDNKHDLALLAGYLGLLKARGHIRELLMQINGLDCCYGPALVHGLGECGTKDDIPFLIEMIDRETESSGGMTNDALVLVTGFNPFPKDQWPYDRQKIKKAWTDWINTRHNKEKP